MLVVGNFKYFGSQVVFEVGVGRETRTVPWRGGREEVYDSVHYFLDTDVLICTATENRYSRLYVEIN